LFDPLGLKTISDYKADQDQAKEERDEAIQQLNDDWGAKRRDKEYNRKRNNINREYYRKYNEAQGRIDKISSSAAYHNETVSQWTTLYNKLNGTDVDPSEGFVDADTLDDETALGKQVLRNHSNKNLNNALYTAYAVVTLGGNFAVRGSPQKAFTSCLDDVMRNSVDDVSMQMLKDGEMVFAVVKDGKVIAQTKNVMLSHKEFVARSLGELPEGAQVITVMKEGGKLGMVNSMSVHGNMSVPPAAVVDTVKSAFK
jgi:hypothetical protein